MKRFLLLLVVSISLTSLSFGQTIEIPKWIVGTWSNTAESNTENIETFIFTTNKIYYTKGLSFIDIKKYKFTRIDLSKRRLDLFDKYKKYKTKTLIKSNLFQMNFSDPQESVTYEFRLSKVDYFKHPVLSYSIIINGKTIREHSLGCQYVLSRE